MSSIARPTKASPPDLDRVGGHPVLNFINTLRADAGAPLETLHSDGDVRAWLKQAELHGPTPSASLQPGALLESTRRLRALALHALQQRSSGKPVQLTELNEYLSHAASHVELTRSKGRLAAHRVYSSQTAEQALAPIAEVIATFLATEDITLVHQCEGSGCVLWFQDRPNGRRRRFCTEETCGTRTRVAAHRARKAKLEADGN